MLKEAGVAEVREAERGRPPAAQPVLAEPLHRLPLRAERLLAIPQPISSLSKKNQVEESERNTAVSGTSTQPSSAGSGTVSAPGVGVGHSANGVPIGMPGSGLGSPGHSEGSTK
jgi:hypothetical protein